MANVTMSLEDFAQLIREMDEYKERIQHLLMEKEKLERAEGWVVVTEPTIKDSYEEAKDLAGECSYKTGTTYNVYKVVKA